jgi:uncharacterized protein (DUF2267 family)
MNYEEIIEAIRQAGGGPSRDTAACAAQATPQTLAERLIRGEARCILQELPAETVTRVSERTTPAPGTYGGWLDDDHRCYVAARGLREVS